ncbi:MAG TPA: hypothetical protein VFK84_12135 [Burkholderiales bacterium]|nr:hypothetical protein [Burkholderiales bacterium]
MNSKPNTLALPDGTRATLILAEPITPQRIATLEDALPAFLRALREQAGALEYDSWRNAL